MVAHYRDKLMILSQRYTGRSIFRDILVVVYFRDILVVVYFRDILVIVYFYDILVVLSQRYTGGSIF